MRTTAYRCFISFGFWRPLSALTGSPTLLSLSFSWRMDHTCCMWWSSESLFPPCCRVWKPTEGIGCSVVFTVTVSPPICTRLVTALQTPSGSVDIALGITI